MIDYHVKYQTSYTYRSCPIASLMIKLIQITYFIHWWVFNENPQLVYTHASIYSNLILINDSNYSKYVLHSIDPLYELESRLVTLSSSLCTQTGIRCLIIHVLNIKSQLLKYLIHFSHFCTQQFRAWVGNINSINREL